MVEMARKTRPFLSSEIWENLDKFMDHMRNLPGNEGMNYRMVYDNLTKADLVKRLLFKRPVVFWLANDKFMLRWNGGKIIEGTNKQVETAKKLEYSNDSPFLREYISYDENLLSALISMSTPTYYVSDGSLKNHQVKPTNHIDQGILCGIVGARNKKIGFMENRFIFPKSTKASDVHKSDDFWIKNIYADAFPEGKIPTAEDIKRKPEIYREIYDEDQVNVVYFEKRLMLSIIPYINEAIARGIEMQREIFCAVPPIGGGVWRGKVKADLISKLIVTGVLKFLDLNFDVRTFKHLKALALPVVDTEIYSSFNFNRKIKKIAVENEDKISINFLDHEVKIFNKFRYVAELLPKDFENYLSIAAYAWDGNSYPGNEYWCGKLSSFDSQAIFSSLLGQFQNPEVNIGIADKERIKVY
jgi:hypothetical protein